MTKSFLVRARVLFKQASFLGRNVIFVMNDWMDEKGWNEGNTYDNRAFEPSQLWPSIPIRAGNTSILDLVSKSLAGKRLVRKISFRSHVEWFVSPSLHQTAEVHVES